KRLKCAGIDPVVPIWAKWPDSGSKPAKFTENQKFVSSIHQKKLSTVTFPQQAETVIFPEIHPIVWWFICQIGKALSANADVSGSRGYLPGREAQYDLNWRNRTVTWTTEPQGDSTWLKRSRLHARTSAPTSSRKSLRCAHSWSVQAIPRTC